MHETKCPYCGKEVSYPMAFLLRRRGEYFCKKCKKESNVYISKKIWIVFFIVLILSVSIMLYFLLMTFKDNLIYVPVALVPFVIFYLLVPLFVRLRPKKKFQDSLYDTEMVESPNADPDPTMAKSAKVVPAFVDDIVLGDDDYKPAIDSDVFNTIKEERRVIADTDGGTKNFDKFENISSTAMAGHTMQVDNLSDITRIEEEKLVNGQPTTYDLSEYR